MCSSYLLPSLAVATAPGTLMSLLASAWLIIRNQKELKGQGSAGAVEVRNPFHLRPALALAALVMGLALVSRAVLAQFGEAELALVLAISGLADVDSSIITLGGLPAGTLDPRMAGLVLTVPVLANSLFKASIVIAGAGEVKAGVKASAAVILSVLACIPVLAWMAFAAQ